MSNRISTIAEAVDYREAHKDIAGGLVKVVSMGVEVEVVGANSETLHNQPQSVDRAHVREKLTALVGRLRANAQKLEQQGAGE